MDRRLKAIADMCKVPFIAVRSGSPIHMPDREAVIGHFAGAIAAYQAAGAAAADADLFGRERRRQVVDVQVVGIRLHAGESTPGT